MHVLHTQTMIRQVHNVVICKYQVIALAGFRPSPSPVDVDWAGLTPSDDSPNTCVEQFRAE